MNTKKRYIYIYILAVILSIFIHSNALAATGTYTIGSKFGYAEVSWNSGNGCPARFTVTALDYYSRQFAQWPGTQGSVSFNIPIYSGSRRHSDLTMVFNANKVRAVGTGYIAMNYQNGSFTVPDHEFGGWQSDDNNHWKACKYCGGRASSGAHNWSGWVVTKTATCTESGSQIRTCSTCGRRQTAVIAAYGHNFGTDWMSNETDHYHECSRCGEIQDKAAHTFIYKQSVETLISFQMTDFTLYSADRSKSFKYTSAGNMTVTSSNPDVASVSWDADSITVTYLKPGITDITATVPKVNNNSINVKTIRVTCEKSKVVIPSLSGTYFEATGQTLGPDVYGYDDALMTQSGTTRASTPGDYVVRWNLKDTDKYCWADGTTGEKSASWKVEAGNVTVHVNYYSHSKSTGGSSGTNWYNSSGETNVTVKYGQTWQDVVNTGSSFTLEIKCNNSYGPRGFYECRFANNNSRIRIQYNNGSSWSNLSDSQPLTYNQTGTKQYVSPSDLVKAVTVYSYLSTL